MRKICFLLIIVVILPLFSVKSFAEGEADEFISDFEALLPEEMQGITDGENLADAVGIRGLLSQIGEALGGNKGKLAKLLCLLLGCVALCSLPDIMGINMSEDISSCVGVICSVLIFYPLTELYSGVSGSIKEISEFFTGLIPITAGVTAMGGGNAAAVAQSGAMYMTVGAVSGFGLELFAPIIALGFALSLLSAFGNSEISTVCKGVKGVFFWLLGISSALITGSFSLQSIVASAQDSITIRAAKHMASGIIPVVGSTVSGALSTLASGLSYAKGVIGASAIIAILSVVLSPLVLLLCYRLAFSVAIALADFVGKTAGKILSAYRFSLDMLIALYSLVSVIYIFEIILFIKIGVALL